MTIYSDKYKLLAFEIYEYLFSYFKVYSLKNPPSQNWDRYSKNKKDFIVLNCKKLLEIFGALLWLTASTGWPQVAA